MNEWMDEWTNEYADGWVNVRIKNSRWVNEGMNGLIDELNGLVGSWSTE